MDTREESGTVSYSTKYQLEHKWIIRDFSMFTLETSGNTDDRENKYPRLTSTPFYSSQYKDASFKIICRPMGEDVGSKNYLGLYLEATREVGSEGNIPEATIRFKLSLVDYDGDLRYKQESVKIFSHGMLWGWRKFMTRDSLFDNCKHEFLASDQLTILAQVDIYPEPLGKAATGSLLQDYKLAAIAQQNCFAHAHNQMYERLLESGDHSDVVLVVDGKELKGHKIFLSAHSAVFKAMFEADMKEKTEGRVVIEDLSLDVAKEMLKFIYTGKTESMDTLAKELLSAADKYEIITLKYQCSQYLFGLLETSNVARLFALAEAHSADELKGSCMKFIRGHLSKVMLTEDWPLIDKLFIEELSKLIRKKGETEAEDNDEDEDDEGENEADEGEENEYPNKKKKKTKE